MDEIEGEGTLLKSGTEPKTKPQTMPESFASKADFPGFIPPMLATITGGPFDKADWLFELKLDGYRVVTTKNEDQLNLYSRNGNLFNEKYPSIARALQKLNADFVIDGEVCYMDNDKKPDFQKLQHDYAHEKALHYYIFDLLWLNGHDLKEVPLILRKSLLKELLKNPPANIHYLDHVEKAGIEFFNEIKAQKLEGIMAKNKKGIYYPGLRSKDWLKIKTSLRQEMLICGFIASEKTGMKFSSVLCAVNKDEALVYTGKVGTGFSDEDQKALHKKMLNLNISEPAVENPPKDKNITWVKPELICEVRFTEWTKSGVMRHPVFMGLRVDKPAGQIIIEKPKNSEDLMSRIELSNPEKVFFPEEKITKKDIFDYYNTIAPLILPHLKNRPQSLYRTPDGIKSQGFFQKDMKDQAPEWAETIEIQHGEGDPVNYLLCQNKDTLLYMVNLGCVEINPWNSSLPHLDKPDYMIFDLDPVDVELSDLVNVALEFRQTFEGLGLPSFVKTSGSRGIHIYIPVKPKFSYTQVQQVVKTLENHVHQRTKSLTSFERSPSKRQGKIYLDYLQNGRGKTMASVYSLRPRKGATISTPLHWDEVNAQLDPAAFNLHTIHDRIKQKGELWTDIFEKSVDLGALLKGK
jgi:bifunctional non-homologous end joining protein LigD